MNRQQPDHYHEPVAGVSPERARLNQARDGLHAAVAALETAPCAPWARGYELLLKGLRSRAVELMAAALAAPPTPPTPPAVDPMAPMAPMDPPDQSATDSAGPLAPPTSTPTPTPDSSSSSSSSHAASPAVAPAVAPSTVGCGTYPLSLAGDWTSADRRDVWRYSPSEITRLKRGLITKEALATEAKQRVLSVMARTAQAELLPLGSLIKWWRDAPYPGADPRPGTQDQASEPAPRNGSDDLSDAEWRLHDPCEGRGEVILIKVKADNGNRT